MVSMQLTSSTWWRFYYLLNNSRMWFRILSTVLEEEMKALEFVLWLNYYYFVLLDCFYLFMHFLISLIRYVLWNLGKAQDAKAFL